MGSGPDPPPASSPQLISNGLCARTQHGSADRIRAIRSPRILLGRPPAPPAASRALILVSGRPDISRGLFGFAAVAAQTPPQAARSGGFRKGRAPEQETASTARASGMRTRPAAQP